MIIELLELASCVRRHGRLASSTMLTRAKTSGPKRGGARRTAATFACDPDVEGTFDLARSAAWAGIRNSAILQRARASCCNWLMTSGVIYTSSIASSLLPVDHHPPRLVRGSAAGFPGSSLWFSSPGVEPLFSPIHPFVLHEISTWQKTV